MKMNIPELGTVFRLSQDWTFTVHCEHRNESLIRRTKSFKELYRGGWVHGDAVKHLFVDPERIFYTAWCGAALKEKFTIAAGTEIKVDRIYIRKGAKNFSSVTVYASLPPLTPAPRGRVAKPEKLRFWVKLADFNTIEYQPDEDAQVQS